MLKSFKVENFKCFKNLALDDFSRFNIIVGKNAAGKTTLLEAIKIMLDGAPGSLPWLNSFRNIPIFIPQNPTAEQFRQQFTGFFHGFHHEIPIKMHTVDFNNRNAALSIYFDPKKAISIQPKIGFQQSASVPQPDTSSVSPTTVVPLAFDRMDFEGHRDIPLITIQPGGQVFYQQGKSMGISSGFITGTYIGYPSENATWLSTLSVQKRSKDVIEALRQHFSFIENVTVEAPFQGLPPLVYADIKNIPEKLPLSAVSAGISRIFTFIVAVVTYGKGVLLIDEIENGIFNDQYQLVWKSLIDLARQNNTQLFVSTHSNECLRAILPIMKDNEDDFTFLRAEHQNGNSSISRFDGKEMEAALANGAEIRSA